MDRPSANTEEAFWSVPMDSAGELCSPAAVAQIVTVGRYRAVTHG